MTIQRNPLPHERSLDLVRPASDSTALNALFLVGPGSVGKTTVGKLVAALTSRQFVDLNARFTTDIGDILGFVTDHGYRAYCEANAALAERIVNAGNGKIVMATSSGFLAHDGCDDVVERNLALVHRAGMSIFLMPAADLDEASRVIAFRQVRRWPDRDLVAEYTIAHARCGRYMASADRVIIASGPPHDVANRAAVELMLGGADLRGRPERLRTPTAV